MDASKHEIAQKAIGVFVMDMIRVRGRHYILQRRIPIAKYGYFFLLVDEGLPKNGMIFVVIIQNAFTCLLAL